MSRSTTNVGPGLIVLPGTVPVYIASKDDIVIDEGPELWEVKSSLAGDAAVDERFLERLVKITFTPVGELSAGIIAFIYACLTKKIGENLFPSTAQNISVYGEDTSLRNYINCACTKPSNLICSTSKTPLGQCEVIALGSDTEEWNHADGLVEYTASGAVFPTGYSFDPAKVLSAPFTGSLAAASAPWNSFATEDGFEIALDLKLTPRKSDAYGTVNFTVSGLAATAKGTLVGITDADMRSLILDQGTGMRRGASNSSKAADLTITGTDGTHSLTALMQNSTIQTPYKVQFSATNPRVPDTTFRANKRTFGGTLATDIISITYT